MWVDSLGGLPRQVFARGPGRDGAAGDLVQPAGVGRAQRGQPPRGGQGGVALGLQVQDGQPDLQNARWQPAGTPQAQPCIRGKSGEEKDKEEWLEDVFA